MVKGGYYDPELGRFISPDPFLDGLNRYTYCHNNPVRYVDPTGNLTQEHRDALEAADGNIPEEELDEMWQGFVDEERAVAEEQARQKAEEAREKAWEEYRRMCFNNNYGLNWGDFLDFDGGTDYRLAGALAFDCGDWVNGTLLSLSGGCEPIYEAILACAGVGYVNALLTGTPVSALLPNAPGTITPSQLASNAPVNAAGTTEAAVNLANNTNNVKEEVYVYIRVGKDIVGKINYSDLEEGIAIHMYDKPLANGIIGEVVSDLHTAWPVIGDVYDDVFK